MNQRTRRLATPDAVDGEPGSARRRSRTYPAGHAHACPRPRCSCCSDWSSRLLAMGYGALFSMLDDIRDEYGIAETALGGVIGIGFFAGFLAQVLLAPIADRGHARHLVLGGMVLDIVGLLMMAAATGLRPAARRPVRDGHRRRHGRAGHPADRHRRRARAHRAQPRPAAGPRRRRVRRRAGRRRRARRAVRDPRAVPVHRRGDGAGPADRRPPGPGRRDGRAADPAVRLRPPAPAARSPAPWRSGARCG